ncbi:MAG: polyprenyl synthetase family protein [Archaeoglobaceae archaeon]|nr:polyprenyl synthetase family protein [Archaeoglobaceae archaeon]MCX8152567.1 polyprenyl synthetase family protein [Archaeoglobaceae archaeon]MDW8014151.1 polyprenyl synthetase family protein [Archaeoglobaceae archaeon]
MIEHYVSLVNEAIEKFLPMKNPEGLYKASRHLIKAGGKRLRPVLCLLAAEALGKDYKKILPAAVSIESIHNFTLIHDDIMDRDDMRRGVPTVHRLYGESTAILAGDTLFAEAFKILAECEVEKKNILMASKLLAEVCVKICEGQYLDVSFEKRDDVSEEEYVEMVKLKTGYLIAASTSLPAILFGEEKYFQDLWDFGMLCGIGFQIHDDVLGITSEETGKDFGSDILKGKKTLIVIKAFKDGVKLKTFGKQKAELKDVLEDVKALEKCGAIDYARKKAKEFVGTGKSRLKNLKDSEAKNTLLSLADYLISRRK